MIYLNWQREIVNIFLFLITGAWYRLSFKLTGEYFNHVFMVWDSVLDIRELTRILISFLILSFHLGFINRSLSFLLQMVALTGIISHIGRWYVELLLLGIIIYIEELRKDLGLRKMGFRVLLSKILFYMYNTVKVVKSYFNSFL